ncbi:iron-containing redox enzyme family protein [Pseudobacteriovorax antillogorgiicola]|uniref:Iron-containing redox enzyme n=1 Tax=Pseudobacteriovorax antillogorgiicola TaxID=1513793 RepID=A0A1Y6CIR3_9BACT|nr:iron-containing redox enzyme family protein [Pseudobacteriovorax antillogorgiicola]TCS46380.1 heme oxygenase-like protein [Pseudobacteriovorax antillogorgiicola]SMF68615.1 Iron-containing redox enzyme [Pseudobacteriovorax antillogorgiicola]
MKQLLSVKREVESFLTHMKSKNPLYHALFYQPVSLETLSVFTTNLQRLVEHTPVHLKLAIETSASQNREPLQSFFRDKFLEEQGHDQWAANDLKRQQTLGSKARNIPILPSMQELIDFNSETILSDPGCYLAYIFLAEYMTVLGTPDMLKSLQENSKIPPDALTILGNHAELDQNHVLNWESEIANLVDLNQYEPLFLDTIRRAASRYEQFCTDCYEVSYDIAV